MDARSPGAPLWGPASVFIAEGDPDARACLVRVVAGAYRLTPAGEAGDFASARAWLGRTRADVVLIDLELAGGPVLDLVRRAAGWPGARVMVRSRRADGRSLLGALAAGATGYLLKDDRLDALTTAIGDLLAGGAPISPAAARHLVEALRPRLQPVPGSPALSRRQREVLDLLARGFSYAEAGALLGISINTIRSHVKGIYARLTVTSLPEALFELHGANERSLSC